MLINEIILYTNLLNELKNFYSHILELNLITDLADNSDPADSFTVKAGSTQITFKKSDESKSPFYHFAFNIPENQLKESKEWIRKKCDLISLEGEDEFDFRSWNAHSIYFYDPAGNILEFIARHNLSNRSQEQFSGESILSVSEIGFPVKDVRAFYEKVNEYFNIPVFSGDMKTFTAAGDDEGLFIIVPEGRRWFPNCNEAGIFPMTVKIISGSGKDLRFENLPYEILSLNESKFS